MPIIKSAKKKMRQDVKKTARNKRTKIDMKESMKGVLKALQKDVNEAEKLLSKAYSAIDKALKKNLIKKNNAARKKSNLAKALVDAQKKLQGAVKEVHKKAKETAKKAEKKD